MYDLFRRSRRSIRLRGYDYARAGAYFVTVCTQHRSCIFGDVTAGTMVLNAAGSMIADTWTALPRHYPGVEIDAFVVMPNHFHAIVTLSVGAGPRACPLPDRGHPFPALGHPQGTGQSHATVHPNAAVVPEADAVWDATVVSDATEWSRAPADPGMTMDATAGPEAIAGPGGGQPRGVAPTMSLADVVHRFKTLTTRRYIAGVRQALWTPFVGRLWQRNYYEHIVRSEASLHQIRAYIRANPERWLLDVETPTRRAKAMSRDALTSRQETSPQENTSLTILAPSA